MVRAFLPDYCLPHDVRPDDLEGHVVTAIAYCNDNEAARVADAIHCTASNCPSTNASCTVVQSCDMMTESYDEVDRSSRYPPCLAAAF
nr:hypothetical protein CFP56_57965 [Quercus suber]